MATKVSFRDVLVILLLAATVVVLPCLFMYSAAQIQVILSSFHGLVRSVDKPEDSVQDIEVVRTNRPTDYSPSTAAVRTSDKPIGQPPSIEAGRPKDKPTYDSLQIDVILATFSCGSLY